MSFDRRISLDCSAVEGKSYPALNGDPPQIRPKYEDENVIFDRGEVPSVQKYCCILFVKKHVKFR